MGLLVVLDGAEGGGDSRRSLSGLRRLGRFGAVALTLGRVLGSYRLGRGSVPERHRRNARRLHALATRQQGLLIKVGQWLATRADLLPDEYVEVLSELQDRVPPRGFDEIRDQVERSLGKPLGQVFARFAEQPIAAASLAQVHEAWLPDGRRVAVKVQYPDIAGIVAADVRNLRLMLGLIRGVERNLDFLPLLDEVERYVSEELDFVHEAGNAEAIAGQYTQRTDVIVPRILRELSRRKVLTMEFVEGVRVTDLQGLEAAGIEAGEVGERLIHVYSEQILLHGQFHADPHPGNVLVQPPLEAGGPPRLVLLDFGVVKRLPDRFRLGLAEILRAMLRGRPADMLRHLGTIGFRTRKGTYEDLVPLTQAMLRIAGEHPDRVPGPELVQQLGSEILRAYRANPLVRIPEDVLLVMRVLGILGGITRQLGVRVNLIRALLPVAEAGVAAARETDTKPS